MAVVIMSEIRKARKGKRTLGRLYLFWEDLGLGEKRYCGFGLDFFL